MTTTTIRTTQDENNQHAVLVSRGGETRIYSRFHSAAVIEATAAALRRDVAHHDESVIGFESLPVAQFRTTKAGRALLLAA